MFYVKTALNQSKLDGIGLFAEEDIPEGKVVYSINPKLDLFISQEEFANIGENEKETISHYGYFDKKENKWHLSFDDIRFCNHSKDSNIILKGHELIAKKDIQKGEEITQDYSEFENLREELKS